MSNQGYSAYSCIHYHNAHNIERRTPYICRMGVDLEVWLNLENETMPCFLDENGHSQPNAAHCAHLRRPTPEEIAAYEQKPEQNERDGEADMRTY